MTKPRHARAMLATSRGTLFALRPRMADICIENHGSVWLVRPLSDDAEEWLRTSVQEDALWFGRALVVEPRHVRDLVIGLREDGFTFV